MDITPPIHVPLAGNWSDLAITSYCEPLYVHAAVLDDGDKKIAIISMELCFATTQMTVDIRKEVEARCNIPFSCVMVASTHIHSGPKVTDEQDDHYSQNVKMLAVTAVWKACRQMKRAKLGIAKDTNELFVHNRRLVDEKGQIAMNWLPPHTLQDCTENLLARDTDVFTMRFEDENGNTLGFVVNYANHNNVRNSTDVNGDVGAYIGKQLRAMYGEEVVTLVLLGGCGDVNWIDYKDPTWDKNPLHYQRVGNSLLGNVLAACANLEYPKNCNLTFKSTHTTMQEREFNAYDGIIDRTFNYEPQGGLEEEQSRMKGQPLSEFSIDISVFTIGEDIAIVTTPGELFAELALDIKRNSKYKYTIISELTNGYAHYLPTLDAYEKGGYEVRKPATMLAKDAGETMKNMMISLLNDSV